MSAIKARELITLAYRAFKQGAPDEAGKLALLAMQCDGAEKILSFDEEEDAGQEDEQAEAKELLDEETDETSPASLEEENKEEKKEEDEADSDSEEDSPPLLDMLNDESGLEMNPTPFPQDQMGFKVRGFFEAMEKLIASIENAGYKEEANELRTLLG